MIREIKVEDLEALKRIHEYYYSEEFNFPDFSNFICAYVVEDNGKIITAGGIRTIAECIAITDKGLSIRERANALSQVLSASKYFTERHGYKELHCFVQDETWIKHLFKVGFKPTTGHSLVLEI